MSQILEGDCLERLKELEDNSIDLIVTDPPYSMNFMGLDWDKAVPPVEVWVECLRVLKPGGFAFVFSAPRLDCLSQMGTNLRSAGFQISFSPISWVFASGFPKATALDKTIDKRFGAEREVVGENPTWREAKRDNEVYQSVDGGSAEHVTAPATDEAKYYSGSYAGYQPKPCYELVLVCMKPLSEPTYVDQALAHYKQRQEGETTVGPGVTWLDDGRIPANWSRDPNNRGLGAGFMKDRHKFHEKANTYGKFEGTAFTPSKGRFSPNLLVESDLLNDGIHRASVKSTKKHEAYEGESTTSFIRGYTTPKNQHGDAGSLSRYFDLDAWFAARLEEIPPSVKKIFPFLYSPKPSKSEKQKGCDAIWVLKEKVLEGVLEKLSKKMCTWPGKHWWVDEEHYQKIPKAIREKWYRNGNAHVTVKPLKIMMYLIEIGSRQGDVVLDPYAGSGTTGVAAQLRSRNFILMERDPRWAEISRCRIRSHPQPLFHRKMK